MESALGVVIRKLLWISYANSCRENNVVLKWAAICSHSNVYDKCYPTFQTDEKYLRCGDKLRWRNSLGIDEGRKVIYQNSYPSAVAAVGNLNCTYQFLFTSETPLYVLRHVQIKKVGALYRDWSPWDLGNIMQTHLPLLYKWLRYCLWHSAQFDHYNTLFKNEVFIILV